MRVVGVAALIAAGVVACGYAMQRVALPLPGRGDVLAVRATTWLLRYRSTRAEVAAGGRWLNATCWHEWLGRHRVTYLTLSNGTVIEDRPPRAPDVDGRQLRRPVALLQAAGCPRVLANRLAVDAESGHPAPIRLVHILGEAALAVRFPQLTVYVSKRSGRPLGVRTPWVHSVFRLVPLARDPSLLAPA
jgi:hypothetical protein